MSANVQTFEFDTHDQTDDDTELVFQITDTFENRYGDQKAVVEAPAPWDTPDELTPANEVVKALEWDDHHYTFDKDREAWTLDMSGLRPLGELAEEEGYEWEGLQARRDRLEGPEDTGEGVLEDVAGAATEGDRIKVRYAKKNGNGENTYKGQVHDAQVEGESRSYGEAQNTGIVFHDEDDKTKQVKRGDRGDVGLFSGGYHPYMGEVLEVTIIR